MILNPAKGEPVQVWYGKKTRHHMPLHGKTGIVVIPCEGRPRNHGVLIDGESIMRSIPCGNLREPNNEPWQRDLF